MEGYQSNHKTTYKLSYLQDVLGYADTEHILITNQSFINLGSTQQKQVHVLHCLDV